MQSKLIKYRIFFIIVLLACCSLFLKSPFHGYYYNDPPYLFYFLITLFSLLVYLIPTDKLIFTEQIIYASIISCVVLIGTGIFLDKVMGLIYGYDSNWEELKSPPLLDNIFFYFISNFSGMGIFALWLKYRKPIYFNERKTN